MHRKHSLTAWSTASLTKFCTMKLLLIHRLPWRDFISPSSEGLNCENDRKRRKVALKSHLIFAAQPQPGSTFHASFVCQWWLWMCVHTHSNLNGCEHTFTRYEAANTSVYNNAFIFSYYYFDFTVYSFSFSSYSAYLTVQRSILHNLLLWTQDNVKKSSVWSVIVLDCIQ